MGPRPDPNYCVYNYCGIGDGDCDPGQCNEGVCVNDVGAQYGLPAHYDVCEDQYGADSVLELSITDECNDGRNIQYRLFQDVSDVDRQSVAWPS